MDPGLVETPGVWGWGGLISFALIVSLGVWGMPQLLVRFYSMKNTRVLRLGTVLATLGGAMARAALHDRRAEQAAAAAAREP